MVFTFHLRITIIQLARHNIQITSYLIYIYIYIYILILVDEINIDLHPIQCPNHINLDMSYWRKSISFLSRKGNFIRIDLFSLLKTANGSFK